MATTAAYRVSATTATTITITITGDPSYAYYRPFIRLATMTEGTFGPWTAIPFGSSYEYTFSGLSPNTGYAINVAYNKIGTAGSAIEGWIQTLEVTTQAQTTSETHLVWTYGGTPPAWHQAIPWAYQSGAWYQAAPWAYNNGWHQVSTN